MIYGEITVFGTPGETRLHLCDAQIRVRLGQALAGGAHSRRILLFESLGRIKQGRRFYLLPCFMAPPARLELTTLRLGETIIPFF